MISQPHILVSTQRPGALHWACWVTCKWTAWAPGPILSLRLFSFIWALLSALLWYGFSKPDREIKAPSCLCQEKWSCFWALRQQDMRIAHLSWLSLVAKWAAGMVVAFLGILEQNLGSWNGRIQSTALFPPLLFLPPVTVLWQHTQLSKIFCQLPVTAWPFLCSLEW